MLSYGRLGCIFFHEDLVENKCVLASCHLAFPMDRSQDPPDKVNPKCILRSKKQSALSQLEIYAQSLAP